MSMLICLYYNIQSIRKVFRPLDFLHILLHDSLTQIYYKCFSSHTLPHNDRVNRFLEMFANILKRINRNTLFTQVFRPFAMRLKIELRSILFPLIFLEMFLQLGVHLW